VIAVLSSADRQVVVEVANIAASPGPIGERAAALLEPLRRVIPFEAASICLIHSEYRGFVSLVSRGYNEACRAYLISPAVFDEAVLVGLDRPRPPMRLQDMPLPWSEVRGWADYMWPAGFREGLGAGLFAADGRQIGLLALNTESARHLTAAARDLVWLLSPLIAVAVDPMRSLAVVAGVVGDATAGIVMTRAGEPLPLPGMASHPLLAAGSALLPVAATQLAGLAQTSFLCPYEDPDTDARLVRVSVLGSPSGLPDYLAAIVLISPAVGLHGLTRRELELMALLVQGWTNPRIAAGLFVTQRKSPPTWNTSSPNSTSRRGRLPPCWRCASACTSHITSRRRRIGDGL